MIFMRDKYIQHLEEEIAYLKLKNSELEEKNQHLQDQLVFALVPVLRSKSEVSKPVTAADMIKKPVQHKIIKKDGEASCFCGWVIVETDPAELQMKISQHYRENTAAIRATRKSWPQIKKQLESAAEAV